MKPTLERLIASGVAALGVENSPIIWGLATAGWEKLEDLDEFLFLITKPEGGSQ